MGEVITVFSDSLLGKPVSLDFDATRLILHSPRKVVTLTSWDPRLVQFTVTVIVFRLPTVETIHWRRYVMFPWLAESLPEVSELIFIFSKFSIFSCSRVVAVVISWL
jgi:hypothetical protein